MTKTFCDHCEVELNRFPAWVTDECKTSLNPLFQYLESIQLTDASTRTFVLCLKCHNELDAFVSRFAAKTK